VFPSSIAANAKNNVAQADIESLSHRIFCKAGPNTGAALAFVGIQRPDRDEDCAMGNEKPDENARFLFLAWQLYASAGATF